MLNILCLWLGARNGCIDSLVKVLGIVLSPGNVAVENVLNSRGHRHNFMKTNSAFSRDFWIRLRLFWNKPMKHELVQTAISLMAVNKHMHLYCPFSHHHSARLMINPTSGWDFIDFINTSGQTSVIILQSYWFVRIYRCVVLTGSTSLDLSF